MVDQNGRNVNPKGCNRAMEDQRDSRCSWSKSDERLALAEWKAAYLEGYLLGLAEIAGIPIPACLNGWVKNG